MTALSDVFVPVRPDTDRFEPDLRRQLARVDASKSGKQVATRFGLGFNGAIGSIVSRSAGLFAAGFAALQGVKVFGGFVNDARESAKISRITANAIKVTGGAAKVTEKQVGALSTAISNKTGIDDETIQTAANMLLTFKKVRNETGLGNDVFNRATAAAADLSVQFGGIDGASKQLGKALNDPIKGTTALAKAGVTFTDQQKAQIETLVKSGNVLAAQKIILGEVESQVGGAAEAAADPIDRLKVSAGNLGESVGTLLLPVVNRFANFMSNELIPGIHAFGAAFRANDGDITSSGFPGFMERLGFWARQAFDYFKTNVLPRLKEFAGFIRDEVVPRLKDFGGYLRDTVMPIVAQIVRDHLSKLKDVFNNVRDAIQENKPQLTQIYNGLVSLAKIVIERVIPFLYKVGSVTLPALGTALHVVIDVISGLVDAWNAIKEPIRAALSFVWEKVSGFFENLINGAAKAFGWVPGLGDKLKTAAEDFRRFRDSVNRSLDGIDDEAIRVALSYSAKGVNLTAPSSVGRRARGGPGGPVHGPGTGTSDQAGLFALSRGEHVLTAAEVRGAGGHRAVEAMRRFWAKGMARGGRAELDIQTDIPGEGPIDKISSAIAKQYGTALGHALAVPGVAAGPPGSIQRYRGHLLNARTIRMLTAAEQALGATFRIMQGSYSTRVAASGGTHSGGGALDTNGPRGWYRAQGALRRAGFASWVRLPSQGPWGQHIHSIAIGDPTASPSAKRQVQSFLRGGDGLGMWRGGPVSFDKGGMLMPGLTLAHNGTGRPEPVGAGVTVQFTNCTFAGTSKAQFTDLVVGAFDEAKRKRRL